MTTGAVLIAAWMLVVLQPPSQRGIAFAFIALRR